jgi:hypothetical protein
MKTRSSVLPSIYDAYYENYSGSTEIRQNAKKQSSPSHRALNVELWDQISVHLIWIFYCSVYLRGNMRVEWRNLLHNLYSSPRHVARIGQGTKVYKDLVGEPEGKRTLRPPRRRREDWIRMDFRETDGGVNWIRLAKDRDRRRAVVISRLIYIDTSLSINIDVSNGYISISRSINVDISRSVIDKPRSINNDISISTYRSINVDISRSISID